MIAIINYGLGNLTSIQNMCKRVGVKAVITENKDEIINASKLILPGVGHFKRGMENLNSSGLRPLIDDLVLNKQKPILGICLGAQLMTRESEEGDVKGLGWVDAVTVRFRPQEGNGIKIPHMGWTNIKTINDNPLWQNLPEHPRFYFVHSYHFQFEESAEISATSLYGYEFVCAFQKGNIFGTQFHPEKSHKFGMRVIENFNKL